MKTIILIFPHQLFQPHPVCEAYPQSPILIVEDSLFFGDSRYPSRFHRQKLILHRASMSAYYQELQHTRTHVEYISYTPLHSPLEAAFKRLAQLEVDCVALCEVVDFALRKRIQKLATYHQVDIQWTPTPGFINTTQENQDYRSTKKRWFMADFYQWQRTRLGILVDTHGQPLGGKWSFDHENRKNIPKTQLSHIPSLSFPSPTPLIAEICRDVDREFPTALGAAHPFMYPSTHQEAKKWLRDFLEHRFHHFGPYEDAMVAHESWLYHSILTPLLNIGLLTPREVLDEALTYGLEHSIPLQSLEGFVRQIVGWREFIRATYEDSSVEMRTSNFWKHEQPLPRALYDGSTGILPVDTVIHRLLQTGYCHHIERLMVLGGFFFLCEIHPDAIYKWFMEMFIDSYDWVMVPNIYSMSQHADGGLITTKPYFCGSNYIRKMSNYPTGPWCAIWDGLYWRWILRHAKDLGHNPRWAMMVRMAQRMDPEMQRQHIHTAERFLSQLFEIDLS